MFIDTHCHLYDADFAADIDDVLLRACEVGTCRVFLPNVNAETLQPMLDLAARHPRFLFPMLGLHPEDLGTDWRDVLVRMEKLLQQSEHPFIAVGEVGLDYYWDRSLYDEQQDAFAIQVCWAIKYGLPLMIHTRSAHRELVTILRRELSSLTPHPSPLNSHPSSLNLQPSSPISGVFHCFCGTVEEAAELLTFSGFMLGIGGVLTFKKSSLPDVLREVVPLDRIVLETDAPYLAPVPYRGKRNEPAFLTAVIHRLAEIYDVTDAEVAAVTTSNALRTFPKAR